MDVIWKNVNAGLETLNSLSKGNMAEMLGIIFTEIGPDYLLATMPVNKNTQQPYGLLSGGASAAFAETIGSVASWLCIDINKQICVGIEVNCNHIRGKKDGIVIARVQLLHIGITTHVWDIKITDERGKLICVSRLTVAIVPKKDR